MNIKSVEFAGAIANIDGKAPGSFPQVAFSGRSNVGKSSLINRLLGRTRTAVARVSSTPGKTREINFFDVKATTSDESQVEFFVVDLPGYGYAKVPVTVRNQWQKVIEWYLRNTKELRGVVQLIDARIEPVEADRLMVKYLAETEVPSLFVVTKVDKLTRSARSAQVASVISSLGLHPDQVVEFSSKTGEGREELLGSIEGLIAG